MSIEKNTKNTLKHEDKGFTTIINETAQNIRNLGAAAIYLYLATKPSDWDICKKQLQKHFDVGRDAIDKSFQFLKKMGLLEVKMHRDKSGKCTGWTTVLKSKIAASIQITENPYSGENYQTRTPVDNSSSRILKNQNLVKPESGKTAPTKQRVFKNERKETNKAPVSVSVFSCSQEVQNHVEYVASMKHLTLSPDQVSQVLFYIGDTFDFNAISKRINIAFKLIREGKWNIPSGWQGITSASLAKKEVEYQRKKEIQQIEDGKINRKFTTSMGYLEAKKKDEEEMQRLGLSPNEYYSRVLSEAKSQAHHV